MIKKTYKVKGMDCTSCAQMIELDLEDAGIKASCSYPKEELTVEVPQESDIHKAEEVVQKAGYRLQNI